MKIVIAMDSFKGSMTSMEAGVAAGEGVRKAFPEAEIIIRPLADGGEGTMEALLEGLGGEMIPVRVSDPIGRKITAKYAMLTGRTGEKTAVIEMAQAAGLTLLAQDERDPYKTTTYGVGEMINDALDRGCRDFLVGIGGSATNDGGLGMLQALGYLFFDEQGDEIPGENIGARRKGGARLLDHVKIICGKHARKELSECSFRIACDVTNPLCGESGATYVYGPQKGLAAANLSEVDQAMSAYADAVAHYIEKDNRSVPGAGAAGGMGFAFMSFLGAKLMPGAELVMQATGLEKELSEADLFLTGEGRIDVQTAMGKAPMAAAQLAKEKNPKCRVLAFAGQVQPGAEKCIDSGFDEIHGITPENMPIEQAMQKEIAKENMTKAVEENLV